MSQKDLVTEDEEKLMMQVLEQFKLDISDAKAVENELNVKLTQTEQDNIHDILQKQAEWKSIITQLQIAQRQLLDMKSWLDKQQEKLSLMQRDIEQIEAENNDMEVQARNHQRLSEQLRNLTVCISDS